MILLLILLTVTKWMPVQVATKPGKVMEFDGLGNCIRQVVLAAGILWSWHAVEVHTSIPQGQYLICHGYYDDHDHRVSLVGAADGRKFCSYGGIPGSTVGQLYVPYHLAVDPDGYIFVADHHNGRVVVLSPDLSFIGCVASQDSELKTRPRRLCLDVKLQLLYVGEDEGNLVVLKL